ncbi:MAG: TIGR02652 family protein [Cyanobacteriota bacterium]|nr:TIGR02652 family protein [Cyanobacteriota bacterium]
MSFAFSYPIFGAAIQCPHCRQTIAALTLTDTYLCHRHGAFEAEPSSQDLVHLQSGRRWRLWQGRWFRQHTHADGIRFEIHEELDRLRTQGMRAVEVVVAKRYQELLTPYLDQGHSRRLHTTQPRLYGLPVKFSGEVSHAHTAEPSEARWQVINFELTHEKDPTLQQLPHSERGY